MTRRRTPRIRKRWANTRDPEYDPEEGAAHPVGVADDGKAGIAVGVTDDLTARFNAVDLVRRGAEALGGTGGGGRPDLAQAGGPDGAGAEKALEAVAAALAGG